MFGRKNRQPETQQQEAPKWRAENRSYFAQDLGGWVDESSLYLGTYMPARPYSYSLGRNDLGYSDEGRLIETICNINPEVAGRYRVDPDRYYWWYEENRGLYNAIAGAGNELGDVEGDIRRYRGLLLAGKAVELARKSGDPDLATEAAGAFERNEHGFWSPIVTQIGKRHETQDRIHRVADLENIARAEEEARRIRLAKEAAEIAAREAAAREARELLDSLGVESED